MRPEASPPARYTSTSKPSCCWAAQARQSWATHAGAGHPACLSGSEWGGGGGRAPISMSKKTLLVIVGPFFFASVPPITMAPQSAAVTASLANMFEAVCGRKRCLWSKEVSAVKSGGTGGCLLSRHQARGHRNRGLTWELRHVVDRMSRRSCCRAVSWSQMNFRYLGTSY